jgi:hypothetical protein
VTSRNLRPSFGAAAILTSLLLSLTAWGICSAIASVDTNAPQIARDPACGCFPLIPMYVVADNNAPFVRGCEHEYILGGGPGLRGNFGLLEFPECGLDPCSGDASSGEKRMECLLSTGTRCGGGSAVLRTATGEHSGAVQAAIESRFARDNVRWDHLCFTDYVARGGNQSRVVYMPITTAADAGRGFVTVTGYAAFFLKNNPGKGGDDILRGEFLRFLGVGDF